MPSNPNTTILGQTVSVTVASTDGIVVSAAKTLRLNLTSLMKFLAWQVSHTCVRKNMPYPPIYEFKSKDCGMGTAITVSCDCGVSCDITDVDSW